MWLSHDRRHLSHLTCPKHSPILGRAEAQLGELVCAGDPLFPLCSSKLPREKSRFLGLSPSPNLSCLIPKWGKPMPCGSRWCQDSPRSCANAWHCPGGTDGRGAYKAPPWPLLCARREGFLVRGIDFQGFVCRRLDCEKLGMGLQPSLIPHRVQLCKAGEHH